MIKKYTAFGREFEGFPVKKDVVDGFELSSPSLHVQSGEEWKVRLQKFWCPKNVFELFYAEVK